jgi:hypothetical protein
MHHQYEQAQLRRGAVIVSHAASTLLTLLQLKRESNGSGNTVTIRPGGLSWRLSEPIESHKCAQESPLLESTLRLSFYLPSSDFQPHLNRSTTLSANSMLNTRA